MIVRPETCQKTRLRTGFCFMLHGSSVPTGRTTYGTAALRHAPAAASDEWLKTACTWTTSNSRAFWFTHAASGREYLNDAPSCTGKNRRSEERRVGQECRSRWP